MPLINHKLINLTDPIVSLPDHPSAQGMTAEQIKTAFDKGPNELKDKLNALIDNLLSITNNDSGADNIGSPAIAGINGVTVRSQLVSLKAFIDAAILGYINDGSITDEKLSNAAGQIKERINNFAPHPSKLVTDAEGVHGLKIEYGTFTPIIIGLTTAGTNTYSTQSGYYSKIGRRVSFRLTLALTAKDINMSGFVAIQGLPFAISSNGSVAITIGDIKVIKGTNEITAWTQNNNIRFSLTGDGTATTFDASKVLDTSYFILSGTYETN